MECHGFFHQNADIEPPDGGHVRCAGAGVYITYSILDFPDLSVDGTVPLGGVISAMLILKGVNPWLAVLAAFAAGAAAGCITGLLHVKLKIRPLLCGILVMTALLSVNLMLIKAATGGMTIASMPGDKTIYNAFPLSELPDQVGDFKIRTMVVLLVVAIVCKLFLDWYLSTKSGMLLRATGSNAQYVTMLSRNPGISKILGLALGNGFAAMAGALITQQKKVADLQLGTGMVVMGLASVIIGISLLRRIRFMRPTTKVLVGSLIYQVAISIASAANWSDQLKLIMSLLFVLVLLASNFLDKGRSRSHD